MNDMLAQRFGVANAGIPKGAADCDGVSLKAQNHAAHALAFLGAEPKINKEWQCSWRLPGIELPPGNFVLNIFPTQFALQRDIDAVFFEEGHFVSDNDRGAIRLRSESQQYRLRLFHNSQ